MYRSVKRAITVVAGLITVVALGVVIVIIMTNYKETVSIEYDLLTVIINLIWYIVTSF